MVRIFDRVVATELRAEPARQAGLDPLVVEHVADDHKAYYPGATPLRIRLVGDRTTGRLLGAQLIGHYDAEVAKRVDVIATAISYGATVGDLPRLDLAYTPTLGSPYDAVQHAADAWATANTVRYPRTRHNYRHSVLAESHQEWCPRPDEPPVHDCVPPGTAVVVICGTAPRQPVAVTGQQPAADTYSIVAIAWGTVELESEVRDWLEGLPTALFVRAAFYIDLLTEQGPLLGEPYTRQLDGKLRELRFHLEQDVVRITYWIAPHRRIVLLTVFRRAGCARSVRSNELGGR